MSLTGIGIFEILLDMTSSRLLYLRA